MAHSASTPAVAAPARARSTRRANPTLIAEPVLVAAASPASVAAPPQAPAIDVSDEAPVPIDRASDPDRGLLDLLADELAATGRRARSRKAQLSAALPDASFSLALRGRLLQPAGAALISSAMADAPAEPGLRARPKGRSAGASHRRTRVWLWAVLAVGILLLGGLAAKVALGGLGAAPINRAGDVANATLVRGGSSRALVAGMDLAAGDEIKVAAGGHATLILGGSQARLAAGSDLKVNVLSSLTTQVALLAGRAYNRVVLPAGGEYEVVTGPYGWTATGTAFDVDRTPADGGGEQVTLLALEHPVSVTGPAANQQIPEGSAVTVVFGGPGSDSLTVGPIPALDFSDPWLISNAKADEALGYPIGALAGVALAPNGTPVASPTPSTGPAATPSDSPESTSGASPSPTVGPTSTPRPTQQPTPTPTAIPSPSPTPTITPQPSLSLSLSSCPGGIVASWSKYTGSGFSRYVTLRDIVPSIPAAYNASKVVAGTSTNSIAKTSAKDSPVSNGATYFYRTLVLGSGNKVLEASDVEAGLGFAERDLGPAAVGGSTGGVVVVWSVFDQPACFSEYQVLYSTDQSFSTSTAIPVTNRLQTNIAVPPASQFSSGDTIWFRVQVVRQTSLGQFVVAQTSGTAPSYTYP
jgi:FecR protein